MRFCVFVGFLPFDKKKNPIAYATVKASTSVFTCYHLIFCVELLN